MRCHIRARPPNEPADYGAPRRAESVGQLGEAAPEPAQLDAEVGDGAPHRRRRPAHGRIALDRAILERGEDAFDALRAIEKAVALDTRPARLWLGHAPSMPRRSGAANRGDSGPRSVVLPTTVPRGASPRAAAAAASRRCNAARTLATRSVRGWRGREDFGPNIMLPFVGHRPSGASALGGLRRTYHAVTSVGRFLTMIRSSPRLSIRAPTGCGIGGDQRCSASAESARR